MDSEDDDLLLAEREFESLRNHSMKVNDRELSVWSSVAMLWKVLQIKCTFMCVQDGFREGRAAGLEKSRQEEFSRGYGDGFSAGVPWGRSLGELRSIGSNPATFVATDTFVIE